MARSSTYVVERERHIGSSPESIRERIVDLHRWRSWSPWEDLDPDLRRSYSGPEAGVGASYAWEGNRKAGSGSMEVVAVDDSRVALDLRFLKPFKSHSTTEFVLDPEDGGTRVTWRVTGPNTFMTRVFSVFSSMDRMIGPDLEKGLGRLQAAAEGRDDGSVA